MATVAARESAEGDGRSLLSWIPGVAFPYWPVLLLWDLTPVILCSHTSSGWKRLTRDARTYTLERPDWAPNEHHWRANCRGIAERSQDLLDGRLGIIRAARALKELAFRVRAEEDEDFRLFRVIDSESDALPAGAERRKESATALEREDARIAGFEDNRCAQAMASVRNLILKYT
jgi:hypothetical protein